MKDQTINKVPNQSQSTSNKHYTKQRNKKNSKYVKNRKQLLRRQWRKLRVEELEHSGLLSLKSIETTCVIFGEAVNPL